MEKDLIEFTHKILARYNATPDEWDAFDAIKRRGAMIKSITKQWLEEHGACSEIIKEWEREWDHGTVTALNRYIDRRQYDWANWLIVRLMTKKQKVMYAIYAAEQVIELYEKECPDDIRPRKAIDAAKRYVARPNKKTIRNALAARDGAYDSTQTTTGAAYHAAYATAEAADAVTNARVDGAACAASDAVRAAIDVACDVDRNDAKKKMWHRILRYGISLIQNQGGE